jgi:hypothetical protein
MLVLVRILIRSAIMNNCWSSSSLGQYADYVSGWISSGTGSTNKEKSEVNPSL